MTEHPRYAVGWLDLEAQAIVDTIVEVWPEVASEISTIRRFGSNAAATFSTPGEAQGFLDHVCRVNSESNLKHLNGIGAQGFFIIEVRPVDPEAPDPWEHVVPIRKYEHHGHIIPVPYSA